MAHSPHLASLERIPPELWQEILSHACSDGGATGRALSLTSRFFHDQSTDYRFHSLELESSGRLLRLLTSLQAYPRECKIRHLIFTPSLYMDIVPAHLRRQCGGLSNHRPGTGEDQAAFNADVLKTFFIAAARQLRSLYLVSTPLIPFRPFAQTFPKLRELSIWNHPLVEPPESGFLQSVKDQSAQPLCPSLRRLHIILTDSPLAFHDLLGRLPALAPSSLTHLRLSGVTYTETALPALLAEMLGLPAPRTLRERLRDSTYSSRVADAGPLVPCGATFPSLRFIVISAVQPRFDADAPQAAAKWTALLGLLRELERTCKRVAGMRMVVLERSWMRKPCWAARLREDWKQRMLGGPGCWVESEAEESKIEGPLGSPKDMDYHLG